MTLTLLQRLQTHARQRNAKNASQDELALYLELERALAEREVPAQSQHLTEALPLLESLKAEGWTVKLSLLAKLRPQEPLPYKATLWRLGMDEGIYGFGQTVLAALEDAQERVRFTLAQGHTRWMGEEE